MEFPKRLDAGAKITVDVETVFANAMKPYPAQITQAEKQFMLFTGNVYYYSPYMTTEQTTTVNCFSSTIESYTKTKPVVTAENSITYGPYEKKSPFSQVRKASVLGMTFTSDSRRITNLMDVFYMQQQGKLCWLTHNFFRIIP